MFGGAVVPNFKTLNPYITFVLDRKYAVSSRGSEMLRIQDCRLAWIASKRNVSIRCIARGRDAYEFFVDSTPHVDGTTCTYRVSGMLNGAPRCRLGSGVRVIPGRRHIEGGVGLAKGPGDAHKQHRNRQQSHARSLERSTLPVRNFAHCGRTSTSRFPSNSAGRRALCPDTVPRLFPVT
jgi:hypothetical protein